MSIFEINTEEDKVIVSATIAPYNPSKTRRKKVATSDVENHLKESGVEFGKCVQSANLNNKSADSLTGTWIFENKIEKPVDKPAKNVILTKEEKPVSKINKSRAKKTSKI